MIPHVLTHTLLFWGRKIKFHEMFHIFSFPFLTFKHDIITPAVCVCHDFERVLFWSSQIFDNGLVNPPLYQAFDFRRQMETLLCVDHLLEDHLDIVEHYVVDLVAVFIIEIDPTLDLAYRTVILRSA